jgi:hypothetical protein
MITFESSSFLARSDPQFGGLLWIAQKKKRLSEESESQSEAQNEAQSKALLYE